MDATAAVRDQYEHFPFPPLGLGALADVRPPQADGAFGAWYVYGRLPRTGLRILDAGCGTGFSTLKLAEANPDAEILAIDISDASLEIARERLAAAGLNQPRVRFERLDLQSLETEARFDYIHSSGVIHHLPDPAAGLRRLRACLAPGGLAYLMVYAAHARVEIQAIQAILKILWQQPEDWREGLMLCRTFFRGLPAEHPFKQHHLRAVRVAEAMLGPEAAASDAFYVDTWLQRCEHLWTQPAWFELLAATGWYPARWLDEEAWRLEAYLPGLPDYVQSLSPDERLAVLDRLRPPQNFALFVTPEPVKPPHPALVPSRIPVRFGCIRHLRQPLEVLDNGRGTQLSLNAVTRACWEAIDGQTDWQTIWQRLQQNHAELTRAELETFCGLLLRYGCVGQGEALSRP